MLQPSIFRQASLCAVFCLSSVSAVYAGCYDECCPEHRAEAADAMVLATVSDLEVLPAGGNRLRTVATLTIQEELLQREVPTELVVTFPGGELGEIAHFDSRYVNLSEGQDYFIHLQEEGGNWSIYQASAMQVDFVTMATQKAKFLGEQVEKSRKSSKGQKSNCGGVTIPASRETATGYFESSGIPGRWRRCDTGQPILVEVDSQTLPSGVTEAEALAAVREALDAWQLASGLTFIITANYDFGMTVKDMNGGETVLHIQLHDLYDEISSQFTLGVGGGSTSSASGGTVGGVGFRKSLDRYVVLNHESSSLSNTDTLAEVLTHEIGHALGLEHSSEDSNESEPLLEEATMYYQAHRDGRGATTNCYDEDRIQFAYPAVLPPVAFSRQMRVVTRPGSQPNSPANRIILAGFSSSGAPLSYSFPNGLNGSVGTWNYDAESRVLEFSPAGFYTDSIATGTSFYQRLDYEVSDGVNSAAGDIKIVALRRDDSGSEPDIGVNNPLPEAWLEETFGAANLRANPTNPLYQGDGDFDGDGVSNLVEFQMDSDAADAASGSVTMVLADDYTWFELQNAVVDSFLKFELGSDLQTWQVLSLLEAEAGTNRIYLTPPTSPKAFFRGQFGN